CALYSFVFFNHPATTDLYALSLHDALPISDVGGGLHRGRDGERGEGLEVDVGEFQAEDEAAVEVSVRARRGDEVGRDTQRDRGREPRPEVQVGPGDLETVGSARFGRVGVGKGKIVGPLAPNVSRELELGVLRSGAEGREAGEGDDEEANRSHPAALLSQVRMSPV